MSKQTLRLLLRKDHGNYFDDRATDNKWYRQYGFPDTERKADVSIQRSFLKTRISPEEELPWGDWILCVGSDTQGLEYRKGEIINWLVQQCGDRILNTVEIKSETYKEFDLTYHLIFTKDEKPLLPSPVKNCCIAELTVSEDISFVPPGYWNALDVTNRPEYSLYSIATNGVPLN